MKMPTLAMTGVTNNSFIVRIRIDTIWKRLISNLINKLFLEQNIH